ncbi:MAG TPA: IclR family transcriptional regulator [Humibacter sp.]|nr:IclR family transcriptional regulator [Humibacter sp.]
MDRRSSMGRGLEILGALADLTAEPPHRAKVSDVVATLHRERSQVSRTLKFLADTGLAVRDGAFYQLGWGWYAQAQALSARRLREDGLTVLESLSADTGEAAFLGCLQGDSTITIAESVPKRTRLIGSWVGRAFPAFCSDAGQAVLWDADDDEVRAVFARTDFTSSGPNAAPGVEEFLKRLRDARDRGYSIVDQEAEPGLYSVAAPVRDFRGESIAALQIVGVRRELVERTTELGRECANAAATLSTMLGWRESSS